MKKSRKHRTHAAKWVVKNWSVGPQKIHRKCTPFFPHHIFHSNVTPIASEISTPTSTANFDPRFVDQTWGNLRGVWPRQRHTAQTNQTSTTLNRKQRTTTATNPTMQFPAQHPPMKICASDARTRSHPQQRAELKKMNFKKKKKEPKKTDSHTGSFPPRHTSYTRFHTSDFEFHISYFIFHIS